MSDYLVLGHNGYLGSFLSQNLDCDALNQRYIHDNGKRYKYLKLQNNINNNKIKNDRKA